MENVAEAAAAERGGEVVTQVGMYLTFQLGGEIFGLEILKVQEIIGIMKVTSMPCTPVEMRGVINLRGQVIPVIDLRIKFSMEEVEDTERTCIIVVQVASSEREVTMAIIVDEVSEVLDIDQSMIEPSPDMGSDVQTDYILGIGKVEEKVVLLLDIDEVLTGGQINLAEAAAEQLTEIQ